MTDVPAIRVLQDSALDGPTNMARDEALLTRVGTGESPPTLRFYQWAPPTISLGYFQHYADFEALDPPAGELAVVRRLTGGGAILHDCELTYSISLQAGHPLIVKGVSCLYEIVHEAIIAALREFDIDTGMAGTSDDSGAARGPFFCFARRHQYDLLLDGAKLAGSAQRRRRTAILQHGSIVLGNRFSQQPTAVVSLDCRESVDKLRAAVVRSFAAKTGDVLEVGAWKPEELELADDLRDKYAGDEWTKRT